MRRHRGGAAGRNLRVHGVDHFQVKISSLQAELGLVSADQHISENGNGIAALHHAVNAPE
jgi:hypothetical protein